jgi:DNA-binding CsgD family transcriptional regulator
LPINSTATSEMSKAPGTTKSNANSKNGVSAGIFNNRAPFCSHSPVMRRGLVFHPAGCRRCAACCRAIWPAEGRVFELKAAGDAPAAVANKLSFASSTIRTHLLHLSQKAGCQRLSELVKLGTSLSLPV